MSIDAFGSFDDLVNRFFGGDPFRRTTSTVQRVNLERLLSEQARELLQRAAQTAVESGSDELDVSHLLWAATQLPTTRALLERAGANADEIAKRFEPTPSGRGPELESPALSPAAKRALLDAHTESRAAGSSYIGPEHILLGMAANRETAAGQALRGLESKDAIRGPGTQRPKPPSTTPTLDQYGRDLTERARDG